MFFLVEYVVCGKAGSVEGRGETKESVENEIEDFGKELLSNSSISEIFNFWDEDDGRETKSLEGKNRCILI